MTCPQPRRTPPRRQRGIATILLVILVGLALIVTVHGVFRAVRGAQEQTLATHAQTPAQATAWNGVEALRRYLDVVDGRTVQAWAADAPTSTDPIALTLTGSGAANLTAEVTNVTKLVVPADPTHPDDNKYTITTRVVGRAGTGAVAAASPLEVVYAVELMVAGGLPAAEPPSMNFFKDVEISGDVRFSGAEHAQVNVLGNVTITSTNLTGVEQVNATGNVTVDSAVQLDRVHSNGNVQLLQGSDSQIVKAQGTVLLSGGGEHGHVQANKTVTFNSSEAVTVHTREDLVVGEDGRSCQDPVILNYDGTYIGEARVHRNVLWHSCGGGVKDLLGNGALLYRGSDQIGRGASGNGTRYRASQHLRNRGDQFVRSAEETGRYTSLGNITHDTGAHPPVVRYCAQSSLSIPQYNSGWAASAVMGYGGTPLPGDPRNAGNIRPLSEDTAGNCDFAIGSAAVDEVGAYTRTRPVIDANVLKGQANVAFELDADGDPKLTVKALQKGTGATATTIADGVYTLGYKTTPFDTADWLCRKTDLSGSRNASAQQRKCDHPIVKLCENDGLETCFKHDSAAVTNWTLDSWNSTTTVRGVLWFKGNLKVGAKGYVNTFIVTGDIDVVANAAIRAPNYAGYAEMCANADILGMWSQYVQSPDLAGLHALNFCNTAEGRMIENRMGNVALIAGSYDGGVFGGGNIRTSGGNRIDGSVMAGNRLVAADHTTIGGNVIGAGQGGGTPPSGQIGNTFRLSFPSIPGYQPGLLPCTSAACMGNQATVRWARYR